MCFSGTGHKNIKDMRWTDTYPKYAIVSETQRTCVKCKCKCDKFFVYFCWWTKNKQKFKSLKHKPLKFYLLKQKKNFFPVTALLTCILNDDIKIKFYHMSWGKMLKDPKIYTLFWNSEICNFNLMNLLIIQGWDFLEHNHDYCYLYKV